MTGQDSEQATGAASARTCARDVPQNRVDWPLLSNGPDKKERTKTQ